MEAGAVELLCPIAIRKELLAKPSPIDAARSPSSSNPPIMDCLDDNLRHRSFRGSALLIGDRIMGAQAAILGVALCAYVFLRRCSPSGVRPRRVRTY